MCAIIWLPQQRREVSNLDDLASLVGRDEIVLHDDGPGWFQHPDLTFALLGPSCLCPVNIPATFAGTPYSTEPDGEHPGDWLALSPAPEEGKK